jgi:hypothetical protein
VHCSSWIGNEKRACIREWQSWRTSARPQVVFEHARYSAISYIGGTGARRVFAGILYAGMYAANASSRESGTRVPG